MRASVRVSNAENTAGAGNCCIQNKKGDMFEKPRISVPFVPLGVGAMADLRTNYSTVMLLLPDDAACLGARQRWLSMGPCRKLDRLC